MIEDAIKEIKDAEDRADELQKEAYQTGKTIVFDAEFAAEKLKKDTVHACRADLRAAVSLYTNEALSAREEILENGEKVAAQFILDKGGAIEKVSDKIVNIFLEKY